MAYGLLADLVLLLHLGFILCVALGGLALLRWPRLAWLHLPAVAWGVWVELSGRLCPLTPLENQFRRLAGEPAFSGDFLQHYLVALIYPDGLTRTLQIALGLGALLLNVLIYGWLWRRGRGPR